MAPTRSRLTTLLAFVAALAVGAPAPLSAAPGGVPGPPAWAGVPGAGNPAGGPGHGPGPAGGSTSGAAIGGGPSGGVGGPTGGLGASHGHGRGGGGGGGAAISPLSPNATAVGAAGPGPSFSVSHGHGHGGGGGGGAAISPLSPTATATGAAGPGPSFSVSHGHGHGGGPGGKGLSDLSPNAPAMTGNGTGNGNGVGHGHGQAGSPPGLALGLSKAHGRDALQKVDNKVDATSDKSRDKLKGKTAAKDDADDLIRQATETGDESDAAVTALTGARKNQAHALIEAHRDRIDPDDFGRPVVRGEILAVAPSAASLARAQRAGFQIAARDTLPGLGVQSVVLRGPRGVSTVEALRRLRALDPTGAYDFNHLYQESGAVSHRAVAATATAGVTGAAAPAANGVRIGLVDGGVAAQQPALAGAHIVQRGFATGGPVPSPHATAVASLMAGRFGRFRGAAPGATLYVADVYGRTPTGGSAESIARALAWLAEAGAPVINISLVGPPNILLEAAVKALIAKGHVVVAAVGNDGPAAPPLYPASYQGVIAVTGVDAHRRLLPEASRGTHVDFAAPGAEMAAAGLDGGFVAVRGTSFAAPLAAGLLARRMTTPDRAAANRAVAGLGRQALDVGARGQDPLFGRGLVAAELRTPPPDVGARFALRGP